MIIYTDYNYSPYLPIIILSFVLSYFFIFLYSRSKDIDKRHLLYSMLLHFIIAMYCGFMFTTITNIIHGQPPYSKIGLAGMGGMIGTIVSIIIMCFIFKEQKAHYIKCYVMSLPLIYGVSKMACFLVGCCYGMHFSGPFSVTYIKDGIMVPDHSLFPVQLVECIAFVLLSAVFFYLLCHRHLDNIVWYEIISCCVLKFLLDYLRDRPDMNLSTNQKACIIVSICIIIYVLIQSIRKKKISVS